MVAKGPYARFQRGGASLDGATGSNPLNMERGSLVMIEGSNSTHSMEGVSLDWEI